MIFDLNMQPYLKQSFLKIIIYMKVVQHKLSEIKRVL